MAKQRAGSEEPSLKLSRLPPGRHGLPREFVTENQLARLTAGTIAAVAEAGFQEVPISQIAKAAGVSRRTFYHYWKSKEACFASALKQIGVHLLQEADQAGAGKEGAQRVDAEVQAVLETFAANPDLAKCALVTPLSAGPEVAGSYRSAVREAVRRLQESLNLSDAVATAAVGGAIGVAAAAARREDASERLAGLEGLNGLFAARSA